jgi:MFS family permease
MSLPNPPAGPLASLQHRNFRLLWTGQVFSMIGSRMQAAALLWHIFVLTRSAFALGWIGLARAVPLVLFALVGGVVADAMDRRRLMLFSQSMLGALAAGLGVWSLLGMQVSWPIYAVAGLSAGVMTFDAPARQSMIAVLVPREHLANAVSLNSITSQLASIAGPALAGLLIAQTNIGWIYMINAASFLAVIVALLLMTSETEGTDVARPRVSLEAAIEGLRFMRQSRILVVLMLLDFLATFFSSATTLLPVYAARILHVGAQGYGWLSAAASVGALAGAVVIAWLPGIRREGALVLTAVFLYGLFTIAFGVSRSFSVAFLALAGTGLTDTVSTVLRQTIRQLVTPDALRGRMTSINMIFFQGGPQLGELEAGLVAGWLGAPFSVVSGGVACMLAVTAVAVVAPWLVAYETPT